VRIFVELESELASELNEVPARQSAPCREDTYATAGPERRFPRRKA
jgi:hypothetical protein